MREERERQGTTSEEKREKEGERIGSLSNKVWLPIKRLQNLLPLVLLSHFRFTERENDQERERESKIILRKKEREMSNEEGRGISKESFKQPRLYVKFSHIFVVQKPP